jgi:hypothetical protein
MQTCPYCQKESNDTETYCYACGHILPFGLQNLPQATTQLVGTYEDLEPQRRWGTAYFKQRSRLQLDFRDSAQTLVVEVQRYLVLGRRHADPGIAQPDIDLTPYGAADSGVSRRHLILTREHDTISVTDLGSANSTHLNGQRLNPNDARILRDNDELRLGRLVIRCQFV